MLVGVRDRVKPLGGEGKTLEAVLAVRPTRECDEAWGKGSLKPDALLRSFYNSLSERSEDHYKIIGFSSLEMPGRMS